MTDVLTFENVTEAAADAGGKCHLLLGNGFSIACRPKAFAYGNLFREADFSELSIDAEDLFELFGTSDFERVIDALRISAAISALYETTNGHEQMLDDSERVKDALAKVLARKHPDNVGAVRDAEYGSARAFLANFDGNIYTVNYDLLLYWTLLQDKGPPISSNDGFRSDPDDPDAEWVVWDGFAGHAQRIFHLHGGLHLYDAGSQLKKITWARTGIPLVDQIRDALAKNEFPLIVTEGSSSDKIARIEHSPYLHRGLKSLNSCGGCLCIYGHSLAKNDEHVLARIEASKVEKVFVSLHGDPGSEENQAIQRRADLMAERRDEHESSKPKNRRKRLHVHFFDATSAEIWNTT
jgi:hypothetical protein